MTTRPQVDAQFDRAVQIVQGLPKTGPIQTGYEDKLLMYSLYKQATVGNVRGQRPGMWDMLGRAKWDAWAKHKDIDTYRAKVLYVDALLKVLRKYSDKTVARDLVREIEAFAPAFSRQRAGSQSSGSSGSSAVSLRKSGISGISAHLEEDYPTTEDDTGSEDGGDGDGDHGPLSEGEAADAARPLVPLTRTPTAPTQRSHSSLSSSRYRTLGVQSFVSGPSTYATPTPIPPPFPHVQPQPTHVATSAFSGTPVPEAGSAWGPSRPLSNFSPRPLPPTIATRGSPVEDALQALQGHVAALQERIDVLEHMLLSRAGPGRSPSLSPSWIGGSSALEAAGARRIPFDASDLGLWSLVAQPIVRLCKMLTYLLKLVFAPRLAGGKPHSPAFLIVRRLALDASFVVLALFLTKKGLKASQTRRREAQTALAMLIRAVAGRKGAPRRMVHRGV